MRLAALALFAVLVLAGCGGDEGKESPATRTTDPATEQPQQSPSAEEEQEPAPGGEASIEGFGSEASGGERDSIEGAFKGYLNAVAEEDFATACSYLASTVQKSLEQLVVKELKAKGCVGILPKLLAPTAPAVAREQADSQIEKVRVEGDRGFVVFRAPGAELYQQTMVSEGGGWKVTTVAPSVLVPEL